MADVFIPGFQWDEKKNSENIKRHGVSFKEASRAFARPTVDVPDTRQHHFAEDRTNSIGTIQDANRTRYLHITHTERNGDIRLISARKAEPKEIEAYHKHIYQQDQRPDVRQPSQERKVPEKAKEPKKLEFFSDVHKPKPGIKH